MPGTFRFDHLIITVDDLVAASEDFRDLGFTVFYGGKHASGTTHNTLIVLEDGSYLELMALTGEQAVKTDAADFSSFFGQGERAAGYALCTADLQTDVTAMQARGVRVSKPKPGQRARPDGEILRWLIAGVNQSINPLLLQDVTPRELRVPYHSEKTQHKNGVVSVESLTVVVDDLQSGIDRYKALLDVHPLTDHYAAHFVLDASRLIVAEATDEAMRAHLKTHQDAPYQITLKTREARYAGLLDAERTHGTRIELVG